MQDQKLRPEIPEPPRERKLRGGSIFCGIRFGGAGAIACAEAARIRISRSLVLLGSLTLLTVTPAEAQVSNPTASAKSPLQEHYEAAQSFQASGNLQGAAVEYRLFVAEALHRLAGARASIGDFAKALPLFDEALNLAPSDVDLRVDYAEACRHAGDLQKAKLLAQGAVDAESGNAKAHLVLGRTLSQLGDVAAATQQFEAAVAIQPTFDNGYTLATAYLQAKDEPNATRVFSEMLTAFGDSPEIHMKFGSAYGTAGYPNQSIEEFKKVIAKNDKYPGAHYSLGAAYLVGLSDAIYPEAAEEFRKELELNPNDYNSHFQLGSIELKQHKLPEAQADLSRATELDPKNPDAYVSLGQLYNELNRPSDAEAALRKAIALTSDVSRNHYQVQRAHYLLARLLLQSGRQDEGKAEMQVSQELMQKSVLQNQGKDPGAGENAEAAAPDAPVAAAPDASLIAAKEPPADPAMVKQVESFENQLGPAVADAYNNLGAIAAGNNDFETALGYFQRAFDWKPALDGLDFNWGKAAFLANQFDQAVGPLGRLLQAHPDDPWARTALGTSFFKLKRYGEALKTLQPMESKLDADPQLGSIYAVCLVKTGEYDRGVGQLQALAKKNPEDAGTHEVLGEALASHGDFKNAAEELRSAVRLDPESAVAKYNLASTLIELHENDEAQALLLELAKTGWQNPHVYYSLGKLQLERGEVKAAIADLETAAKLSPNSGPIHHELAEAYRQDSRTEDADREMKLYEALRNDPAKSGGAAKPE
jgi:tetratricopeptide (TPR) repeat protein